MSPNAAPRIERGLAGGACGPSYSGHRPDESHPVVLVDEAVLPGETHRLDANWDEEMAVLAGLSPADGRIVLLPRAVHHSDARPTIGVLAVADAVGSDDFGQVQRAWLFGLRRVEVRSSSRRGALLVAEIGEIHEGEAAEADLGRLLRLSRRVARRESLRSRSRLSPELGEKSPSQIEDALAVEFGASDEVRLTLLRATNWVDRLPVLERLAKPRRTRLGSPRARRPRSSEAADEQLPATRAAIAGGAGVGAGTPHGWRWPGGRGCADGHGMGSSRAVRPGSGSRRSRGGGPRLEDPARWPRT